MTMCRARSGSLPVAGTVQRCILTACPVVFLWRNWLLQDRIAIHNPVRDWNRPEKRKSEVENMKKMLNKLIPILMAFAVMISLGTVVKAET